MSKAVSPSARSGGCQCGAIRYRIDGPFGHAGVCHCRMCQKAFGSWGAALVSVKDSHVTWTRGHPAEFRSSAIVSRGFCSACGTPLYMNEDASGVYDLAIGTLDDPSAGIHLEDQAGIEGKVSWFDAIAQLPARTTSEDRKPEDLAKLVSNQHPDHDTDHWPSRSNR